MKRGGDDTFAEEDQTIRALESSLKGAAFRPLFKEGSIPGINSHRELHKAF